MNSHEPLPFQIFNEISIIDQLAVAMFERAIPKGMTKAQFGVLNHFVRLNIDEKSPGDLASAFQVTRPTMTSTLGKLERGGYVVSKPDPNDGRGKLVSITAKGRDMRERCIASIDIYADLLDDIVPADQRTPLLEQLRSIREALDGSR